MNIVQKRTALLVVGLGGVGYALWKLKIDGFYQSEIPMILLALGVGGFALYVWQAMPNADQPSSDGGVSAQTTPEQPAGASSAQTAHAGSGMSGSAADEIAKLAALRDRGLLNDEELNECKRNLLGCGPEPDAADGEVDDRPTGQQVLAETPPPDQAGEIVFAETVPSQRSPIPKRWLIVGGAVGILVVLLMGVQEARDRARIRENFAAMDAANAGTVDVVSVEPSPVEDVQQEQVGAPDPNWHVRTLDELLASAPSDGNGVDMDVVYYSENSVRDQRIYFAQDAGDYPLEFALDLNAPSNLTIDGEEVSQEAFFSTICDNEDLLGSIQFNNGELVYMNVDTERF